ncbi:hypothetical protein AA313_de0210137 [Arthrobotrys entomopaga]|nr:hypothetical protein AA313_de0210137 [Arthrobotrys entomopaga]
MSTSLTSQSRDQLISILSLPVEIQQNIISYLPDIEDQLNVSHISPIWEEIVLTTKSLRKKRYEALYSGISVHTLLKQNTRTSELYVTMEEDRSLRYMYRFRKLKDPNEGFPRSHTYSKLDPALKNWEDKDITDSSVLDEPLFTTQFPWFTWLDVCHPNGRVKKGAEMPLKPRMDPNPWGNRKVTLLAALYIKQNDPAMGVLSGTKQDVKFPLEVEAKGATVRQAVEASVDILVDRIVSLNGDMSKKKITCWAHLANWTNKVMDVHISAVVN